MCNSADLLNSGDAVPFDVVYCGRTSRGFAIRFEGQVYGYLNQCAHVPMEMDYQPNRFFDSRVGRERKAGAGPGAFLREVAFNGSIFILLGSFAIGAITGDRGMTMLKPFILDPFAGVLCLFLLDMGLVAGRGLKQGWNYLSLPVTSFAVVMPLIGATIAAAMAVMLGLSIGSTAVLITLAASASYIAVPAAMRLALPAANPAIALTLSLGVTFPFNLLVGIPLYIAVAKRIAH